MHNANSNTRAPTSVLRVIAADASCEFVWICSRRGGTREALRLGDICAAAEKPCESPLPDWKLVYDVMRVHRGSVVFAQDHMQRIATNCAAAVGAESEMDVADISSAIVDYIRSNDSVAGDVNLKFIAWLPPRDPSWLPRLEFALYFVRSFYPPAHWYRSGARVALLYDAQREAPNVKTVQAALRARATALQERLGAYEALLVRGRAERFLVPEGSRSNFVLATRDGRLLCSREADILVGVTLRAVRRQSSALEHRRLFVGDVCAAAGVALLGTSPGVLPVAEVVVCCGAEGRRAFAEALAAYEREAPSEEAWRAAREAGERALANGGVLRFDSAANDALTQLREAYEAEAHGEHAA